MRKYTAFLLTSLAFCACSTAKPANVPEPVTPPVAEVTVNDDVQHEQPVAQTKTVGTANWSMTIPANMGAVLITDPPGADPRHEFKGKSADQISGRSVLVNVESVTLDKTVTETNFGQMMVTVATHMPALNVVLTSEYMLGTHPATLMGFIIPGNTMVLQLSVGHKNRGYVVRCGGDLLHVEKVVAQCQPIMTSFQLR